MVSSARNVIAVTGKCQDDMLMMSMPIPDGKCPCFNKHVSLLLVLMASK